MISFENVRFSYRNSAPIIETGHLELGSGLTLVIGPNGCGKSTLMKIAAGVEKPEEGNVLVDGIDLWEHEAGARRPIAYVPEHPDVTPYASIEEVLELVCRFRGVSLQGASDAADRAGITAYLGRSIRELSQGQRRRVLIAAAWIGEPRVLILDEPMEAMDTGMRRELESWIRESVERERTVLLVAHDFDRFVELASAAVSVRKGRTESCSVLPASAHDRAALLDEIATGGRR